MEFLSTLFHWVGREPCFRIHGKARREKSWREIAVYASHRNNLDSRWPLLAGSCITWTAEVILIGWDMAELILSEQRKQPASRDFPVAVQSGRLSDSCGRRAIGANTYPSASEIMAHECGHTWQALRIGPCYLPIVGAVTWFREGHNPWNRFENEASEQGLFGGIVNKSVCSQLLQPVLR